MTLCIISFIQIVLSNFIMHPPSIYLRFYWRMYPVIAALHWSFILSSPVTSFYYTPFFFQLWYEFLSIYHTNEFVLHYSRDCITVLTCYLFVYLFIYFSHFTICLLLPNLFDNMSTYVYICIYVLLTPLYPCALRCNFKVWEFPPHLLRWITDRAEEEEH